MVGWAKFAKWSHSMIERTGFNFIRLTWWCAGKRPVSRDPLRRSQITACGSSLNSAVLLRSGGSSGFEVTL